MIKTSDVTRWLARIVARPEEEVLLSGVVSGRGALFRKVSSAHTVHRRPSILPKCKCREATTGNGGSSGSGSTEVSICSLGLVICVLDITTRDLRCVLAISRTRARVSSPARRGASSLSFFLSLSLSHSVSSAILTYERNRSLLLPRLADSRASSSRK